MLYCNFPMLVYLVIIDQELDLLCVYKRVHIKIYIINLFFFFSLFKFKVIRFLLTRKCEFLKYLFVEIFIKCRVSVILKTCFGHYFIECNFTIILKSFDTHSIFFFYLTYFSYHHMRHNQQR